MRCSKQVASVNTRESGSLSWLFFNRADNTRREKARPKATDAAHLALYLPALNGGISRPF
jgi:hypothetical protein